MHIIAGLGNPGKTYAKNRHNIGFMAVDVIADMHRFGPFQKKFSAEVSDGTIAGARVLLVKPQTYMNLSGQSIASVLRFYKLDATALTVLHDELDLPFTKLRVKTGGGHGGHNGLKSIDAELGTKDYRRVRLGIGHPGDKDLVSPYVLSDFPKTESEALPAWLAAIAREMPLLLSGDEAGFMNKITLAGLS